MLTSKFLSNWFFNCTTRYLKISARSNSCYAAEIEKILKCRKDVKLEVCLMEDSMLDPRYPTPKVVIVGAGIAGLSAAQKLSQNGICDVTILEATDRPGGRVQSYWLDEAVVELGAQWIEGASVGNPIFNLACQEGLLPQPLQRRDLNRGIYMTSEGKVIDMLVNSTIRHSFKLINDQAFELYGTELSRELASLHQFFDARIQQELKIYREELRYEAGLAMSGMLNELRSFIGADLDQVETCQYGSLTEIPGGQVRVPGGMIGILAPLIRDLPSCNIRYCKPVQTIHWGKPPKSTKKGDPCGEPKSRLTVVTCDGHHIPADFVIVTVSLGVLKEQQNKLFEPSIPKEKIDAIKTLGYGHIDNIYMDYSRPFWIWQEGTLRLSWALHELNRRNCWMKGTGVIEEMPGSQQVLMCSVAGEKETTCIEGLTDVEIAEGITKILRQFTGDETLPYPSNVLRSKWTCNRYFRGAKSFLPLGASVGHQCVLATPLPVEAGSEVPKILFAGEATCPGHYGTMHGARMSGLREADRILNITKRLCGPPKEECET